MPDSEYGGGGVGPNAIGSNNGPSGQSNSASTRSRTNSSAPYGYSHDGRAVSKAERDAWNARKKSTGMNASQLYRSLTQQAVDPMAAFYEMMAGMGEMGGEMHMATGPSEAEIEAERIAKGGTDLEAAYKEYMSAAETATNYVNNQINEERSRASLMGIAYAVNDEAKTERINNYFSELYSADEWTSLQDLNTNFGDPESPREFLVQRGIDTATADSEAAATTKKTTGTAATGFTTEDTLGTASLATGA